MRPCTEQSLGDGCVQWDKLSGINEDHPMHVYQLCEYILHMHTCIVACIVPFMFVASTCNAVIGFVVCLNFVLVKMIGFWYSLQNIDILYMNSVIVLGHV